MASREPALRESSARDLEIDGVVITIATLAFAIIGTIFYFALGYASGAGPAPVAIASAIVSAALVLGWLGGYPHRATAIAVSLVLLAAVVYLPRIFVMDGLLLREAAGMQEQRLRVAIGLNVGGVFIGFLCLLTFGFLIPLGMSAFAVARRLPGAATRLDIHVRCALSAIILLVFPFSSFYDDLSFALLKPAREAAIAGLNEIYVDTAVAPAARFPRLACCENTIHVFDDGQRFLFPDSAGPGARGMLFEKSPSPADRFRVLRDYGGGWRLVEIR